jgi:hypothetical protein
LIVCRSCRFENASGDQFCGSCGLFLAWNDQLDAGASEAGVAQPVSGLTSAAPGGSAAGSGANTPGQAGGEAAIPAPAAPPGELVRCPGCGIANAPTRIFCQSCGYALPGFVPKEPWVEVLPPDTPQRPSSRRAPVALVGLLAAVAAVVLLVSALMKPGGGADPGITIPSVSSSTPDLAASQPPASQPPGGPSSAPSPVDPSPSQAPPP